MPTENPRVYVTLSPSIDSLIGRMSQLERVSKSQLIREILEAAQPTMAKAVAIMEAASKARLGARKELAQSMEQAHRVVESELDGVLSSLASQSGDLVSAAQEVRGRRPLRGERVVASRPPKDPPPSNRGVKSPKQAKTGVAKGVR